MSALGPPKNISQTRSSHLFDIQNIQNSYNPTKLESLSLSFFYFDQHASTLENKARFVSWWNLAADKTRIRGVENHGGGVADLKHRDQFPSTVLSWPQHGNGIFIRRTSPVIPGNAIFILQGKTRMLRPRMLMVSKDRNENEGRIKLCSNHREFRLWRLVSLRRGRALVSRKKIVYKINVKIKHYFVFLDREYRAISLYRILYLLGKVYEHVEA